MKSLKKKADLRRKLFNLALKYQRQSHSPYSKCSLGAAVLMSNGKLYGGCNIENASFGATVCAERVAIWKGLSENKKNQIKEILVLSPGSDAWPPCGICRQVLAEFSTPKAIIYSANAKGIQKEWTLDVLLPEAFENSFLKKKS